MTKKIDEQSKEIKELLSYAKDTKEDINTLLEFSIEQAEQAEISEIKATKSSKDRINIPSSSNDNEMLIIIKTIGDYDYYVIRGTISYVKAKFRTFTGISYKDRIKSSVFFEEYINVPNARHLFRAIKDYYTDCKIISSINKFSINVSEDRLKEIIKEIFNSRYTIAIEEKEQRLAKYKANKKVSKVITKTV